MTDAPDMEEAPGLSLDKPQRACSPDEPVMVAWKAYQATDDYKNTRNWALHEKHVDGSLWAAFSHGFIAARPASGEVE